MKFKLIAVPLVLAFLATACGTGQDNNADILKKLNSSYDNDGMRVELSGYLGVPELLLLNEDSVLVGLYSEPGRNDGTMFALAKVRFGQQENSFYVPDKYTGLDVEIYDGAGRKHGYSTMVKVEGTVRYNNKDWEAELERGVSEEANMPESIRKEKEAELVKKRAAAEERRQKTGDPNDYGFEIIVGSITAL